MVNKEVSKSTINVLITIVIVLIIILGVILVQRKNTSEIAKTDAQKSETENSQEEATDEIEIPDNEVYVVPTMQDKIGKNSAWCGTFQLVWNDLQNNLTDGVVTPISGKSIKMLDNLNSQTFTEDSISDEYFYKNWGYMSSDLKTEIENGIKKKFNETSDILDLFDWPTEEDKTKLFFYSMLKREFKFETKFDVLDNANFGETENVEYFGIKNDTSEIVANQIEVLYYNDENDFAVLIYTSDKDQLMLVNKPEGDNFEEIYEMANQKAEKFEGNTSFGEKDTLEIPNLDMDIFRKYKELEDISFVGKDSETYTIAQGVQTIKMELDNEGGKIKSEAAMGLLKAAIMDPDTEEPRDFNFNDEFAIYLIEEGKEPYFAARISDITLFK